MKFVPMKVDLIDTMGTDLTVVNAARVSFSKISAEMTESDVKLINYLAKHNHWTPFGHCMAQFKVKAPIFVARQLVKHQIGLVWNEVSRRYVSDEPEFWLPKQWRGAPTNGAKQGSSGVIAGNDAFVFTEAAKTLCEDALLLYNEMLDGGMAPEQARMILPQNMMTEWWWTGSLAAWARVCKLRLDPHAQAETREVAEQINHHMSELFPFSWKALDVVPSNADEVQQK